MLPGGSDKDVVDGETTNVTNSSSSEKKDAEALTYGRIKEPRI